MGELESGTWPVYLIILFTSQAFTSPRNIVFSVGFSTEVFPGLMVGE